MLGKDPTSVQNAITLAQKKDAELHIIEGSHNHDPEHEVYSISNKYYQNQNSDTGPCHGCSGPYLKDCEIWVHKRCKPNLDNYVPARCPKRKPPTKQQWLNPSYNSIPSRNQLNDHDDPNVQLSVSTSKPDYISELLEATKEITRYFKKSYKNSKSHHVNNNNSYPNFTQISSLHPDKHVHKTHNPNDQVNEITGQTWTVRGSNSEPEDTNNHHDSDRLANNFDSTSNSVWLSWANKIIEVTLSDMKYAVNFPVTINRNNTVSLIQEQLFHVCPRHASTNYNPNPY